MDFRTKMRSKYRSWDWKTIPRFQMKRIFEWIIISSIYLCLFIYHLQKGIPSLPLVADMVVLFSTLYEYILTKIRAISFSILVFKLFELKTITVLTFDGLTDWIELPNTQKKETYLSSEAKQRQRNCVYCHVNVIVNPCHSHCQLLTRFPFQCT